MCGQEEGRGGSSAFPPKAAVVEPLPLLGKEGRVRVCVCGGAAGGLARSPPPLSPFPQPPHGREANAGPRLRGGVEGRRERGDDLPVAVGAKGGTCRWVIRRLSGRGRCCSAVFLPQR